MVVPSGTQTTVVERLNRELSKAVDSPNVRKIFVDNAFVPLTSTPTERVQIVNRDLEYWRPFLERLGVKPE